MNYWNFNFSKRCRNKIENNHKKLLLPILLSMFLTETTQRHHHTKKISRKFRKSLKKIFWIPKFEFLQALCSCHENVPVMKFQKICEKMTRAIATTIFEWLEYLGEHKKFKFFAVFKIRTGFSYTHGQPPCGIDCRKKNTYSEIISKSKFQPWTQMIFFAVAEIDLDVPY